MAEDREELLARVAGLYYYHDRSQQEIAEQLSLSRSNISRMLKEARERKIVEIFINHPLHRSFLAEQQLAEQFGLREALVVESVPHNPAATLHRVAQLAARVLDENLAEARVLGLSWGTTVHAIANIFAPRRRYDVEVVQLMGGVASADPAIDGPALVQHVAHMLTDRYRYLHAPLVVDTPDVASSLLNQRNIAEALDVAVRADVALVGIGALDPMVSSLLRAGYLSHDEFEEIRTLGGVGDICARHFDAGGRPVAPALDERLIAISLEQLAAIPTVIGTACGQAKAAALLGALRGGYLDILVTDSETAELVLLQVAQA